MRSVFAAVALIAAALFAPAAIAANPADGIVLAAGSGGKVGVVCVAPEAPAASSERPAPSGGVELAQGRGAACVSRCRDSLSSCESGCKDYQCRSSCSSRYSSCLSRCPP
jgi:hypothetical protein